jgi:hypothetical protein
VNWDIILFFPLGRHACPNLVYEPALKLFVRLQRPSADNQSVRIEDVDHHIPEQRERVGLNPEHFPAHRIAALRQIPHEFCGLGKVADPAKFVAGMPREEKRKKAFLNRRERADRLQISRAATVTYRLQTSDPANALEGNKYVAHFSAKSPFCP